MKFWTILYITIQSGQLDGSASFLVYPSLESCEAAARAVSATLPYDHSFECLGTDAASSSLRPKANPFY